MCNFQTEHIQANLKNHAQTWANANQELYSKNGEEYNLSVSAHIAQSNPFLLVTLCSVQTASSLLWATPKGSVQHRMKMPIWISTPSTEHLIPTVTLKSEQTVSLLMCTTPRTLV
jgi:hypothetical protein